MEVAMLTPPGDMDFEFRFRPSPFFSAPPSPDRLGELFLCDSAPVSPTRVSNSNSNSYSSDHRYKLESETEEAECPCRSSFAIASDSEDTKWVTPEASGSITDDFVFEFNEDSEKTSRSAEELFDGGKLRPLFVATETMGNRKEQQRMRGGGLRWDSSAPRSGRRTRSLSLGWDLYSDHRNPWEEQLLKGTTNNQPPSNSRPIIAASSPSSPSAANSTPSSSPSSKTRGRKWRLKNLFLFRSASESDADHLEYTCLFKKNDDGGENRGSSQLPALTSRWRRRGKASAHELHYKANRAVSEDQKKKTILPYKQGIFSLVPLSRR